MGWAKFSDDAHGNEHILPLGHATFRLWVTSIWDNRGYKDGRSPFISTARAEALCRQQRIPRRSIKDIESAGRWEPTEGGWNIHDYSEYLPTRKEDAENAERDQKKQEAGRKGAAARWHTDSRDDGTALVEPKRADSTGDGSRARGRVEPVPVPEPVPVVTKAPPGDRAREAVVRLKDADDSVERLQLWWHEFIGRQISEHDRQAAAAFVIEYPRLGLNGIQARILEHAAWRVENNKPALGKLEFYRDTLKAQEVMLADSGVPRPRPGAGSGRGEMESVGKVLAS